MSWNLHPIDKYSEMLGNEDCDDMFVGVVVDLQNYGSPFDNTSMMCGILHLQVSLTFCILQAPEIKFSFVFTPAAFFKLFPAVADTRFISHVIFPLF